MHFRCKRNFNSSTHSWLIHLAYLPLLLQLRYRLEIRIIRKFIRQSWISVDIGDLLIDRADDGDQRQLWTLLRLLRRLWSLRSVHRSWWRLLLVSAQLQPSTSQLQSTAFTPLQHAQGRTHPGKSWESRKYGGDFHDWECFCIILRRFLYTPSRLANSLSRQFIRQFFLTLSSDRL